MKILSSLLVILFSYQASAEILAQYEISIFFAPEPVVRKINIEDSGRVFIHERFPRSEEEKTTEVGSLSPLMIAKLTRRIESINDEELTIPDGPRCMDAPRAYYRIKRTGKEMMTVKAHIECKIQFLKEQQYAITEIVNLFDGYRSLIRL